MSHPGDTDREKSFGSQRIRRFRRRLGTVLLFDSGLRALTAGALVAGVVVLALRVGLSPWGDPGGETSGVTRGPLVLVLVPSLVLVLVVALVRAWRAIPPETSIRALLDRHEQHGGLLMAGAETEIGAWRQDSGSAEPPILRWRSGRVWAFFAGAAAFLLTSFLVPTPDLEAAVANPLEIADEIAELEESLDVLEEEGLLDEGESESLEWELEELQEEASGDDPARAWEALDHLRELAEQLAEEASEAAFTEGERLAAAAEVAESMMANPGSEELRAQALEELAGLMARAAAENRLLDETLAEQLAAAAADGNLEKLLADLGQGLSELEDKLGRLHEAGLIDLETLLEAKKSLEISDEALMAYLDENLMEAAEGYCTLAGPAGLIPGRGGINRGRADAPMTWREEVSRDGAAFEAQVLDPASLQALEKSGLIGLQAADPSTGGRLPAPSIGVSGLDPNAAGSGSAHTHTVLPRHRGAVRRFFGGERLR